MATAPPRSLLSNTTVRRILVKVTGGVAPLVGVLAWAYRCTLLRRTRVAVTVGSYGKTTTNRALSLALTGGISRYAQNNARFWPSHSLLRTPPGQPFSAIEVGISKPGEMAARARILRPDIVAVTSIGSEHHNSLGTLEDTRAEKARMVEALPDSGVAVLNGDDHNVAWMRTRTRARVVTFGEASENDVQACDIRLDWPRGTRFLLRCAGEEHEVSTRLIGRKTLNALLATAAVAHAEGLALPEVLARLEQLEPMRARLQTVVLPNGAHLIRDEHKSSLETIHTALDLLAEIPAERKIIVLGEVSEPPGAQGPIYKRIAERCARMASMLIFVGSRKSGSRYNVGVRAAGMPPESFIRLRHDVQRAVELLKQTLRPGDVVLLKGRDTQHLDRVALGLMGREVRCTAKICRLKATDCDTCAKLETGWPGNPLQVP